MPRILSSLRARVTLLILLGLVPAIVFLFVGAAQHRARQSEHLRGDALAVASAVAAHEHHLIGGTHQLLKALSLLEEVKAGGEHACDRFLADVLSQYTRYLNLGIANLDGDIVCSALPSEGEVTIADRKYFVDAIETGAFSTGEYQVGRITGHRSINFGHPIVNEEGAVIGVLYAALDLTRLGYFEHEIESVIPPGSILTEIDHEGTVLSRVPDVAQHVGMPLPEPSVLAGTQRSRQGIVRTEGEGDVRWFHAFATVESRLNPAELGVVLSIPEGLLLAEVNRSFRNNLIIVAIVGVALLALTWIGFELNLMRQIRHLVRSTRRLAEGDLSVRSRTFPLVSSELRSLTSAFNQMTASLQERARELIRAYDTTLEGWVYALDLRDKETEGHTRRVTEMTVDLARSMGIPEEELVHVRRGALLHDIGKLGIPDDVLHKPRGLTDEEWSVMKEHPVHAFQMLNEIAFLRPALDIPHYHHERWDGSGYPHGLRGEEIPLIARIFAVVDVWDALTSDRPYRDAWPPDRAEAHLRSERGNSFDPDVVDAFLEMLHKDQSGDTNHNSRSE